MTDLKKLAEEYCAPYTADHWSLKDVRRNAYLAGARAALEIAHARAVEASNREDAIGNPDLAGAALDKLARSIRSLLPEVST